MKHYSKIKKMINSSKGNHMGRKDENMEANKKEALKITDEEKKKMKKHEDKYEDRDH